MSSTSDASNLSHDDDDEPRAGRLRRGPLAPNPALWAALEQGPGLRAILEDFYAHVYVDARLAPFFAGIPQGRVIEKQYAFLREIFTGEKTYFGDRPKNAHHWMVVDDDLFDHREALMMQALERYGLAPELRVAWRAMEEVYRRQIVKDAPVPLRRGGVDFPLEGVERVPLSIGSVCDGCGAAVDVGAFMWTHVRTGRSVCDRCHDAAI